MIGKSKNKLQKNQRKKAGLLISKLDQKQPDKT